MLVITIACGNAVRFGFCQTVNGAGLTITPDMSFAATLKTASGDVIAELEVLPFADQANYPGYVHLTYSGSTANWPAGMATTDVIVKIGNAVRVTGTQSFPIQKSITTKGIAP